MKRSILLVVFILLAGSLFSQVKTNFEQILIDKEKDPTIVLKAYETAGATGHPVEIYIPNQALMEAVSVEDGKIVYAVITNFLHPFKDGYCTTWDEIQKKFNTTKARLTFADGHVSDNTGEVLQLSPRPKGSKLLLVPSPTTSRRNVFAFDYNTGDLVDTAFVPYSYPTLSTPRKALQIAADKIIVADQVTDGAYLFDTSGTYIGIFAPAGGVNNAILDNVRDVVMRENGNFLITNASGATQNTVQQFDANGAYLNSFATQTINSPYCLLFVGNEMFLSNSSGTDDVTRYDRTTGAYKNNFLTGSLNFPQQMILTSGNKVAICEFSGTLSGLRFYDVNGVLTDSMKNVTGLRGCWELPNGNFIVTNSTGIYEIDKTTGALIRTIVTGVGFSLVSDFDPNYNIPVEMTSFRSSVSGNSVTLSWTTATEKNNRGFELQREENGIWTTAGFVEGNGTTVSVSEYLFTDINLKPGSYSYRLKQSDFDGAFRFYNLNETVEVGLPVQFELSQNYPNPFNPSTSIRYQLATSGKVSLRVFDMLGKEVAVLVDEIQEAGYYEISFRGENLSSGVYFYRIEAGNFSDIKKLVLVK